MTVNSDLVLVTLQLQPTILKDRLCLQMMFYNVGDKAESLDSSPYSDC